VFVVIAREKPFKGLLMFCDSIDAARHAGLKISFCTVLNDQWGIFGATFCKQSEPPELAKMINKHCTVPKQVASVLYTTTLLCKKCQVILCDR
jgi:hypothetical protein